MAMIEWKQIALEYPCDTCMAGPGEKCMTMRGKVKWEVHADRSDKAARDQWKGPDAPQGRHLRITTEGESIGEVTGRDSARDQQGFGGERIEYP